MYREEINKSIRKTFDDILKHQPTGKELERKKKVDKLARQEKEDYEKKRAEFYNNPLHWDNNKRRRYGLPVLRGKANKYRSKRYPSFRPTAHFFCLIEDIIEETITNKLNINEFFGQFVEMKDVIHGDVQVFEVIK